MLDEEHTVYYIHQLYPNDEQPTHKYEILTVFALLLHAEYKYSNRRGARTPKNFVECGRYKILFAPHTLQWGGGGGG